MRKSHTTAKEQLGLRELIAMGVGGMIGGALVGTFLGVLLAYALMMPIASLVGGRRDETINYYNCIKAGLVAYLSGYPPQIAIEYARKVLFVEVQPTFDAVEKTTTESVRALAQKAQAA